ncbi:MAG: zinc-dependent alcohol dehydrogenase family protein [Bryobacteraceae bacterium]|nr:zinc-dependent alcohol dehydrogenase family protein [Bryobacteraceae bacterium]
MKIRAAVLREMHRPLPYAQSRPFSLETVDLDGPGDQELLIRVHAAGLCHSDLSTVNGDRPRSMPMVLGHEAAGVVLECGSQVTDLAPGDHVVMVFAPRCGRCGPCIEGRPGLCEPGQQANAAGTLLGGHFRLHQNGERIYHHIGVSAFAECAVVHRGSVVKVPAHLPFEQAALFGCAVLTGVGAVVNTAKVPPGARVAVIGLGGVGLNAILGATLAGASDIIAIDVHPSKLALAKSLGATQTYDAASPSLIAEVKEATQGGVDFAFEMAGATAALETAYRITRRGGTTVTASLPHPDARWPMPPTNLVAEERTLKGSYIGSCVAARDVPRFIQLFEQGRLPVTALLSERLSLDEINEGFDRLASGQTVRQIISLI